MINCLRQQFEKNIGPHDIFYMAIYVTLANFDRT